MKSNKLFEPALVQEALKQSLVKLDPRLMIKNPVMFTVEIGTLIMGYVTIYSLSNNGSWYVLYIWFLRFHHTY
ncbi:MAG: hypothetical protein EOO93_28005 [Pedobacter sp.]|nr:MAG: hypothetical protein EOO93_28005 [Pedobacter sp.]